MRKDSGFTLIELIVVVAIVAVLAGAAIPNFISWLPGHRLRSGLDDLNTAFQLAKLQAIRENGPVVVRFDTANDSAIVFLDDGAGNPANADNQLLNANERVFKRIEMPAGIDIQDFPGTSTSFNGQPWFGYTGRGFLLLSNTGTVRLVNSRGAGGGIAININGNPSFV